MHIGWLPQNVCGQIDRITQDFIWKGNQDHGINLVGWDTVTFPKSRGGLGVRTAHNANIAMLGNLIRDLQTKARGVLIDGCESEFVSASFVW